MDHLVNQLINRIDALESHVRGLNHELLSLKAYLTTKSFVGNAASGNQVSQANLITTKDNISKTCSKGTAQTSASTSEGKNKNYDKPTGATPNSVITQAQTKTDPLTKNKNGSQSNRNLNMSDKLFSSPICIRTQPQNVSSPVEDPKKITAQPQKLNIVSKNNPAQTPSNLNAPTSTTSKSAPSPVPLGPKKEIKKQEKSSVAVFTNTNNYINNNSNNNSNDQDKTIISKTRYWTKEEHKLYLEASKIYGAKNYVAISKVVKTRNPKQVRTHWQKYEAKVLREQLRKHVEAAKLSESKEQQSSPTDVEKKTGSGNSVSLCSSSKELLTEITPNKTKNIVNNSKSSNKPQRPEEVKVDIPDEYIMDDNYDPGLLHEGSGSEIPARSYIDEIAPSYLTTSDLAKNSSLIDENEGEGMDWIDIHDMIY